MTTWADYLDQIRLLANDSKMSDDDWLSIANWSLTILSRDAGPKRSAPLAGDGPDYDLPDDFTFSRFIEARNGGDVRILKDVVVRPGDTFKYNTGKRPTSYVIKMKNNASVSLTSDADAGETYTVYYVGQYADIDPSGNLPIEESWKEVALSHLMIAYFLSGTEMKRARLEQYASAPELKVGNPATELAEHHFARYRRMIAERA